MVTNQIRRHTKKLNQHRNNWMERILQHLLQWKNKNMAQQQPRSNTLLRRLLLSRIYNRFISGVDIMKFIDQAKEKFSGLKQAEKAYVFQAVWFGKLVPGMNPRTEFKVKGILSKLKQGIGKFPGVTYENIYLDIQEFKDNKLNEVQLKEKLFVFYPINSSLTLKVNKEEAEFNKHMRTKLEHITSEVLQEVYDDLKISEERDKLKVLATI